MTLFDDNFLNWRGTGFFLNGMIFAHMHKLARLLVLWSIAIALPAQGVFAGSLPHCVDTGRQVVFDDNSSHAHSRKENVEGASQRDAHATQAHIEMHRHIKHEGSSHSHHGTRLKGSCSACAACCGLAAPPPKVVGLSYLKVEQIPPSLVAFEVVTFLTDGPERPPRFLLA